MLPNPFSDKDALIKDNSPLYSFPSMLLYILPATALVFFFYSFIHLCFFALSTVHIYSFAFQLLLSLLLYFISSVCCVWNAKLEVGLKKKESLGARDINSFLLILRTPSFPLPLLSLSLSSFLSLFYPANKAKLAWKLVTSPLARSFLCLKNHVGRRNDNDKKADVILHPKIYLTSSSFYFHLFLNSLSCSFTSNLFALGVIPPSLTKDLGIFFLPFFLISFLAFP